MAFTSLRSLFCEHGPEKVSVLSAYEHILVLQNLKKLAVLLATFQLFKLLGNWVDGAGRLFLAYMVL